MLLDAAWAGIASDAEALLYADHQLQLLRQRNSQSNNSRQSWEQHQHLTASMQETTLRLLQGIRTAVKPVAEQAGKAALMAAAAACGQEQHPVGLVKPKLAGRKKCQETQLQVSKGLPSLSFGDRQYLLQRLLPAMSAIYTLEDMTVVQAVIAFFQELMPLVICPALYAASEQAAGHDEFENDSSLSTAALVTAIHTALAAATTASTSAEDATTRCKGISMLVHAQAAGMHISASILQLLLPLAAGFQSSTGIHPLAASTALQDSSFESKCRSLGCGLYSGWKNALMVLMTTTAQIYLCVGAEEQEQAEEAEDMCACLQLLLEKDLAQWIATCKQQQQQQAEGGTAEIDDQQEQQQQQGEQQLHSAACASMYWLWLLAIQDCSMDSFSWGKLTCARVFKAMEAAVHATGGSSAFLSSAICSTLDTILTTAAASGNDCFLAAMPAVAGTAAVAAGSSKTRIRATATAGDVACRLCQVLCSYSGMSAVLLGLLELHATSDKKKGSQRFFDLLRAMHRGDTPTLVIACCRLLKPESNCPLEVRLQAISVIEAEVDAALSELDEEQEDLHAALWPAEALHDLFFTLMHDQAVRAGPSHLLMQAIGAISLLHHTCLSLHADLPPPDAVLAIVNLYLTVVQVRRAAVQLLSLVAMPQGSSTATSLVRLLLAKMRDKDAVVQERAMDLVMQLPLQLMATCCSRHEWVYILRHGMHKVSGVAPEGEAEGKGGSGNAKPTSAHFCSAFSSFLKAVLEALVVHQGTAVAALAGEGSRIAAGRKGSTGAAALGDLSSCVQHPIQLLVGLGLPEHVLQKALLQLQIQAKA